MKVASSLRYLGKLTLVQDYTMLLSMIIPEVTGKQDKNAVYEPSVLGALSSHWLEGELRSFEYQTKLLHFVGSSK